MGTCPRCQSRQRYFALLLSGEGSTIACADCGAPLRVLASQDRRGPYMLTVGLVAVLLCLSVTLSQDFITTVGLLLLWTVISLAAYPLVLVVRDEPQAPAPAYSESK